MVFGYYQALNISNIVRQDNGDLNPKKAIKKCIKKLAPYVLEAGGFFIKGASYIVDFDRGYALGQKIQNAGKDLKNPELNKKGFKNALFGVAALHFGDYFVDGTSEDMLNMLKNTQEGKDLFFSVWGNTNLESKFAIYNEYKKIGGINAIKDLIKNGNIQSVNNFIANCPQTLKDLLNEIYSNFDKTNIDELAIDFISSVLDGYICNNTDRINQLCTDKGIDINKYCNMQSSITDSIQKYNLKALWKEYYSNNKTLKDVKEDSSAVAEKYNLNYDTLSNLKKQLGSQSFMSVLNGLNTQIKYELVSDSQCLLDKYFVNASLPIYNKRKTASDICEIICDHKNLPVTKELMLCSLKSERELMLLDNQTIFCIRNANDYIPTIQFDKNSNVAIAVNNSPILKQSIKDAIKKNNNNIPELMYGSFSSAEDPDLFGAIHNYHIKDGKIDEDGYFTGYLCDIYDFKIEEIQKDNGDINTWHVINNYAVGFQESGILNEYKLSIPIRIKL